MIDLHEYTHFVPLIAVGLDLLFGDPQGFPHPVRAIGALASGLESMARTAASAPGAISERVAGALCTAGLVALVSLAVLGLTSLGTVGFLITLYLCYAGLALRCLLAEAGRVHRLLLLGRITEARVALSMLVSRDTARMTEADIRRSLAETVSENLCDGFTAPLFWLCVAGPAGMWACKTVSTLDSMWGYRTEEYRDFGWFAAKADDVLAWIPARLTALAMLLAGAVLRLHVVQAIRHFWKDARTMESPNAGWPMAAAAWLIGARMGGPTSYFGEIKDKPVLGPADSGDPDASNATWTSEALTSLTWLCLLSGLLLALAGQWLSWQLA